MTRPQVITLLWVLLFIIQLSIAMALAVGVAKQSPLPEQSTARPLELSKVYGKVLADGGQLGIVEQRRLLGLCRDLEGMLQTHVQLETSILQEARQLFVYALAFVGATVLLQVLLIWVSRRRGEPAR